MAAPGLCMSAAIHATRPMNPNLELALPGFENARLVLDDGPTERSAVCLRRVCERIQLDWDKGSVEHACFHVRQRILKTKAWIRLGKLTTVQEVLAVRILSDTCTVKHRK